MMVMMAASVMLIAAFMLGHDHAILIRRRPNRTGILFYDMIPPAAVFSIGNSFSCHSRVTHFGRFMFRDIGHGNTLLVMVIPLMLMMMMSIGFVPTISLSEIAERRPVKARRASNYLTFLRFRLSYHD
eukprot:TRINITY_DN9646_c0_g1_i2.p2 TRINITY_DN9646_c0_g1~~TRINITY_DN9646_c0_g1_i2.p2  ORF type:complete len:128 (+),score=9.51 TRINITY_DN9646_c0_g1_i2:456-839(+)